MSCILESLLYQKDQKPDGYRDGVVSAGCTEHLYKKFHYMCLSISSVKLILDPREIASVCCLESIAHDSSILGGAHETKVEDISANSFIFN